MEGSSNGVWGAVGPEVGAVGVATGQCGYKEGEDVGQGGAAVTLAVLFTFTWPISRKGSAYQTLDKHERPNIFIDYLLICFFYIKC